MEEEPAGTGPGAKSPPPAAEPAPPSSASSASDAPSPAAPATPRRLARADTLRDRIVEHLKTQGTDSISGIARLLAQDKDAPVHRLTIAGYLQALAEAGVLRELDRPPSKLYQLQNPEAHWSLHQRIHRALQETPRAEADRVRLALAALQTLLGRPVFAAELLHAGFAHVPDDLPRVVVGDGTRRQYRELFARRSSPRIPVPPRDPLLQLPLDDPLLSSTTLQELLRRLLVKATGVEHLVAERPPGPQQAQLALGGAP